MSSLKDTKLTFDNQISSLICDHLCGGPCWTSDHLVLCSITKPVCVSDCSTVVQSTLLCSQITGEKPAPAPDSLLIQDSCVPIDLMSCSPLLSTALACLNNLLSPAATLGDISPIGPPDSQSQGSDLIH